MTKTTHDNDMINRTDMVYKENQTELPCLIWTDVYDKNNTWQRHDKLYKSDLHQN